MYLKQDFSVLFTEVCRLNKGLEVELAMLQAEMASKGLYWLLKHLATVGVNAQGKIPVADIPDKLKEAQARIDEIETELGI